MDWVRHLVGNRVKPATGNATRLLFLTQYDENGASSRVRIYQFLPFFREAGFHCDVRPLIRGDANRKVFAALAEARSPLALAGALFGIASAFPRRFLDVIQAWGYDAVVVQKDLLPFGLRALLRLGQPNVVFEFDDPIWLPNPTLGRFPRFARALAAYRKHCLAALLRSTRLTIVDTRPLKEFAEAYVPNVVILSSPIDTSRYREVAEANARKRAPARTLGWIGSPATTYLIRGMFPLLEKLAEEVPFTLVNVGSSPLSSDRFEVRNVPWTPENELACLREFDVGLLPSDESPFNRYRFGYKAVIYYAARIPALGTDTGLNRDTILDGETGFLYAPDDARAFVEKAKRLLVDDALRGRLGESARRVAEREYDLRALASRFVAAVRGVTDPAAGKETRARAA